MSKVIKISQAAARRAINLANSENSTGPRTEAGKAVSSQNARKHGLCSFAVLDDEDPQAYSDFRASLLREYRPATPTEQVLVEHIAQNQWLLDRVRRREAVAFATDSMMLAVDSFKLFHRYATGYERALYKAIETLRKIQAASFRTEPPRAPSPALSRASGFVPQNLSQPPAYSDPLDFSTRAAAAQPPQGYCPPEKKAA